jgi:anaerobic magnesium-protoporphyrin IX monomethyl ester cyclase
MKKILFTHSYFYKFDPKQWRMKQPFPPLMTITAAAFLRKAGYEVELFDTCLKDSASEIIPVLKSFKPDYVVVFDDGFNYLTKMCLTNMREAAFEMQKFAKKEGAIVITCSSDSTDHFEKYLANGADFVIKGEGEITLNELIKAMEASSDLSQIQGLTYIERNGNIHETQRRPALSDLDLLPLPAWDLIEVDKYRKVWLEKDQDFYLNIATTRGCPYKCNWCAKPIYGQRYNTRSPVRVVDEIEMLQKDFGVDFFWMCDDIFGLKPGWVKSFNKELKYRNLSIKYKIQTRADLLLEEDNIAMLVASGLDEAWMGAESGSQKILDAMDKGTTINQIEKSTGILKSKGVKVGFFIQFGYLGETKEDLLKTFDLVLKMMPDRLGISVSYPLPGTKFHEKVKQELELKSNWTDSDDLDMMFQNTFPKDYYKILHRLLHGKYGLKKAKADLRMQIPSFNKKTIKNGLKIPYHFFRNKMLESKLHKIEKHVGSF